MIRPPALALGTLALLAAGCAGGGDEDAVVTPDDSGTDDTAASTTPHDTGPQAEEGLLGWLRVGLDDDVESIVTFSWTGAPAGEVYAVWSFEGEEERTTPSVSAADHPSLLLLGATYDTEVAYTLYLDDGAGPVEVSTGAITTGALPEGFPLPELLASDPARYEPTGTYLMGSINDRPGGWEGGQFWKFFLDRQARPVWVHLTPDKAWSVQLHVAQTGDHIVYDESTYWSAFDDGAASVIKRMTIDAEVFETTPAPGLHHPFTELPDGTLVWGAASGWMEDLVSVAPGSDEIRTIWSCEDWLAAVGWDWYCQSNTITYDEVNDDLIFSLFSVESFVVIDHETGESQWWAGDADGGFAVAPEDDPFSWQHGVHYTEDRTLLMSSMKRIGRSGELVAREYEVDTDARTMTQIWSYGIDEGIYGSSAGEAWRLPNGDTLHNYGTGARVKEVTPEGEIVWDIDFGGQRLIGRTVFVEDLYAFAP